MQFTLLAIIAIVVTGLLLIVLTRYIQRQREIANMMFFRMDFLINESNKTKRYRAATELGRTKSPEALLILIEAINDESAEQSIREAARDALFDMSQTYRGFRRLIAGLLAASEAEDHERTIELLKEQFENEEGIKSVHSAYVIGRELVKLEEYADAREWLRVAEQRERRSPRYVDHHIRKLTEYCDRQLFAAGDKAFAAGDYHLANERFALAAHGLSYEATNRFAYYLRAACAYCKLEQYENASQALLQGLQHQTETDTALELNRLLSNVLNLDRDNPQAAEEHQSLSEELDRFVNKTMEHLATQNLHT